MVVVSLLTFIAGFAIMAFQLVGGRICRRTSVAASTCGWVFSLSLDPRYGALAACFVLFLPASIVMGMVSPYCVRLTVQTTQSSGNTSGVLSFVHTIGSALGTILTSFYLVALLEVHQILYAIAIVLVAGAL